MAPSFYAVHRGHKTGVFDTWAEIESLVKGYPNARYKKFTSRKDAFQFVETGETNSSKPGVAVVGQKRKPSHQHSSRDTKKQKSQHAVNEQKNSKTQIVVYTDGACRNNQDDKKRRASFGVFFGDENDYNTCGMLPLKPYTNQRGELYAILRAFQIYEQQLQDKDPIPTLAIYSDSKYSIDCITQWVPKWKLCNWLTSGGNEAKNLDILKPLDQYIQRFPKTKIIHVPAHCGIHGNECADKLANQALDDYEQQKKTNSLVVSSVICVTGKKEL